MRMLAEDEKCIIVKKENEAVDFTMEDQALFIRMYRKTIYKNKLRIVPQEYMANARDSHRESGKEEVPIEVTVPTPLEPTLVIQDFGPGINNERSKTFSSYGASTKRSSDKENGGFGIGCKCAWSYTESFIIETVCTEDDGKKYRRVYSAYITHELDPGKLRPISEVEVQDSTPTGTKICIPIMEGDVNSVERSVETVAACWDVKPIVTNKEETLYEEKSLDAIREGTGWKYIHDPSLYAIDTKSFVVIDGICYNIDLSLLRSGKSQYEEIEDDDVEEVRYSITDDQYEILSKNRIVLFFDVNEVEVSPDRETLDYSARTINAISEKASKAIEELINGVKADIIKEDSDYLSILKSIQVIGRNLNTKLEWNGIDMIDAYRQLDKSNCMIVERNRPSYKRHSCPWDLIGKDRVAVLHYSSLSGVSTVSSRLSDNEEYFDHMEADTIIIFYQNGYGGLSTRFTSRFVTHQKIAIPKGKREPAPKSALSGVCSYDGGWAVEDVSELSKHALFLTKRYRVEYLEYYGPYANTNKKVMDREVLLKLFPAHRIYTLSKVGENKLKKLGYKVRYVNDYLESAVRAAMKAKEVLSYTYYHDIENRFEYQLDSLLKSHGKEILDWAERNNKRSIYLAVKVYSRLRKEFRDHGYTNTYRIKRVIKMAEKYGLFPDKFDSSLFKKMVKRIKSIPFYGVSCSNKTIMKNIISSYREVEQND